MFNVNITKHQEDAILQQQFEEKNNANCNPKMVLSSNHVLCRCVKFKQVVAHLSNASFASQDKMHRNLDKESSHQACVVMMDDDGWTVEC